MKQSSRIILFFIVCAISACQSIPKAPPNTWIQTFQVRKSNIPNAGNGVFATVRVPPGTDIGGYSGVYIGEADWKRLVDENKWHYVMQLPECAVKYTSPNTMIDGIQGSVHTRINYAPAEFQNVKYDYFCEQPFVRLVTIKEILPGEELYVDYGESYTYFFMEDPAVKKYFATLRKAKARKGKVL